METEPLFHSESTMIHSKHAKEVIANDKIDQGTAHCVVEGIDAIYDTIPLTFLQLAQYFLPEPIYTVEKLKLWLGTQNIWGTRVKVVDITPMR